MVLGVSRDDFLKLMQHSEIPQSDRCVNFTFSCPVLKLFFFFHSKILLNLMHLGYTVLTEENVKAAKRKLKPKERPGEKYEVSRWTPLLQDIAEVNNDMMCVCASTWYVAFSMQPLTL